MNILSFLRGWVEFPIDGTAREPSGAGIGEIPMPTVKVWMRGEG